ncbi:GDSL esterase/lipase 5 [Selaginella moellendorffii]|uniref:GDSL esterase/lipase 5 n=1 Tax=Selaginella moellendorffii TaxID=88036 RepID=UPI000D1CF6B8|nr:GDSL esterase/lipase 5 [Selaginella moellendorffii]|eukprot:XP_024542899.1 GDSL esterase/lipase 5 [Selaginella moellendorffii]
MEALRVLTIVFLACISISQAVTPPSTNPQVQGLFVFGDSALDGGENTYIPGSKIVSAVPPYGKTYFSKPTGRWTDGRTIADFLAQALGLPLLPPFLEPGANFLSGVNFASAGAGLLDETNAHHQLRQFRNVTNEYRKEKGVEFTNHLLKNSVALFSMGANDIANALPSPYLFQQMIQAYSSAIQAEKACCGGGPFNAAEFCGDADKHDWKPDHKNKYAKFVCDNPKDYLYFDSNHFTEAGYWFVMKNFWYGSYNIARPSSLNFFFAGFNVPNPPPRP